MTGEGSIHQELRDDLAAYALGALGREEAPAVAEHLADCEPCREYVRWLQPAVDLLPASVGQLEPPERLRTSLMDTVRAEAAAAAPRPARGEPAREPSRWRSWRGLMLRPATAMAAIAVLAVGAAVGYGLAGSGSGDERELVRAQATGSAPPGAVAATLEHGAGGDAILHVERIPALERGDVYQTWISRGGQVEPAASFRPGADGGSEAALGDSLDGADAVLVTEEPGPGRRVPSTAPLLEAPLG